MIAADFRTLLLSLAPDGTIVEKGKVSSEQPPTRIFFERSAANQDLDLDGTGGLIETLWDIEVGAVTETVGQALVETLKGLTVNGGLHGHRGTTGATSWLGIFVSDHDDQYQPNLLDDDEGYFVATFQALTITT